MSWNVLHVLHLGEKQLRWVSLEGGSRHPKISATAEIEAAPMDALEQWIGRLKSKDAHIVLYDSRPMYFSFVIRVPKKAKKQLASIAKLKIAQELGLPESDIFWSARTDSGDPIDGQEELELVVARRDALRDISDWRDRHGLKDLWVGSDVGAVNALTSHGLLPEPVLVMNADRGGAILYYAQPGSPVMKGRAFDPVAHKDSDLPSLGWSSSTARADFGGVAGEQIRKGYSALHALPTAPPLDFTRNGWGSRFGPASIKELSQFDAVLLGGLTEHLGRGPVMESLLRPLEETKSLPGEGFLKLRWVLPAALLAVVAFGVSAWSLKDRMEIARSKLVGHARSLNTATDRLRSQEAVLKKIKTDRSAVVPIIELIHKDAPNGVTLQKISIGETGTVQIVGTMRNQDGPTMFFDALSSSDLFERVELPEVKQDRRGGGFTFNITARMKGRSARNRVK